MVRSVALGCVWKWTRVARESRHGRAGLGGGQAVGPGVAARGRSDRLRQRHGVEPHAQVRNIAAGHDGGGARAISRARHGRT